MNAPKKTKTRRYRLIGRGEAPTEERIIIATSASQALSHAARTDWDVEVLGMEDAIRLTKEGVIEEVAGEDATNEDQLSLDV